MAEIPNLSDEQWSELTERLTLYADCKLVKRYWRGLRIKRGGTVTKGVDAGDLAADAIVSVIDGTRGSWDKERYPTFYDFLKSVIDSKISSLVRSGENRQTRLLDHSHGEEHQPEAYTVTAKTRCPDEYVEDAEWKENFRSALAKELGDDTISLGLFDCLDAGMTDRSEIAEMLEVSVNDIYNAQKRLQRRVESVMKKQEQGKKP